MGIVKVIGMIIYAIVCIAIIILALLQAKDSTGASGAVVGGNSGSDGEKSFYEKNIGRTKEGKMRRWTVILGIVFALLTLGFGIFLELTK